MEKQLRIIEGRKSRCLKKKQNYSRETEIKNDRKILNPPLEIKTKLKAFCVKLI